MRTRTEQRRAVKAPEERRQDLLDAAIEAFTRKGVHESTVEDVTRTAGVAKGTFYLYFDSKEQLLGSLKQRFVDELVARAGELSERIGKDDWWALAETTVTSMIDFMLEHRSMIQIFAQEGHTPDSNRLFAECQGKLVMMMAAGIQAGIEASAFRVADPLMTAALLSHAIDGTLQHSILYEGELDRIRLIAAANELMRKALAPPR
ncbi:MAG: TetR/AcrR family transcriptional regulator [Actinomycetota bacterium]